MQAQRLNSPRPTPATDHDNLWSLSPPDLALSSNDVHVWRTSLKPPARCVHRLLQALSDDSNSRFGQPRIGFSLKTGQNLAENLPILADRLKKKVKTGIADPMMKRQERRASTLSETDIDSSSGVVCSG